MGCEAQELLRRVRLLDGAVGKTPLSHLIALCTLVPQAAALCERVERLFARMPPAVAAEDLETASAREALIAASLRTLADGMAPDADGGTERVRISGAIDPERVNALIAELSASPFGSVVPWLLCAELLGTSIECRGARSPVLEPYRLLLLERLVGLADQSPQIFARWLVSGDEPALDERLSTVLDALRGAAALAT